MEASARADRAKSMMLLRSNLKKRSGTVAVEDIEKRHADFEIARNRVIGKSFSYYVNGEFEKADKEKRLVTGIASSEALDSYGDIVRFDAMKAAFDDYMKFGNIREMHGPSAVGTVKDYELDAEAKITRITSKIVDDQAWNKVLEGVYKGYSIGGKILEAEPLMVKTTDDDGNEYEVRTGGLSITKIELIEISLVDRPACPEALIESYKARGVGSSGFSPDVVFSGDLAKSEPKKSDSLVKTLLFSKSDNQMNFEKVWNNVTSFFKSQDDVDVEAMKGDQGNVTLTKGQVYDIAKQFAEKAAEEAVTIKSEGDDAGNGEGAGDADDAGAAAGSDAGADDAAKSDGGDTTVTAGDDAGAGDQGTTDSDDAGETEAEKAQKAIEAMVTKAIGSAVDQAVAKMTEIVKGQIEAQNAKIDQSIETTKNYDIKLNDMMKKAGFSTQKSTDAADSKSVFKGMLTVQ